MNKTNICFTKVLKNIIYKNNILNKAYNKKHPNSKYSLDLIIDEIIYILKTGVSWRNLRSTINHNTLYWHFKRFVKFDIFSKLFNHLRKKYFRNNKSNVQLIDSSFILNKYGRTKISRNKFFKNKNCNKISILTDINGIPLSVFINKGSVHDITFVDKHIKDCYFIYKNNNHQLLADKAYESKNLRKNLLDNNCQLIVPKKKNAKIDYYFDKILYKKRIRVENTFQKLKSFRKILIRFEALYKNYLSFVLLGASIIICRSF